MDLPVVEPPVARVNGVPLHGDGEPLAPAELRQRACTELLRQAAMDAGLLPAEDPPPVLGAISEAAGRAIESLLERELPDPAPDEAACRRHFAANAPRFAHGERVQLRHVLFAVTPGVDLNALRQRAEACLLELRARDAGDDGQARFAQAAGRWSNCPSGADGGALGWLGRADCAPELAREVFGRPEVGVLPRLVHTRFGLHVVEVLARRPGQVPAYEQVQSAVAQALRQQHFATALRQYLERLAARATLEGVDLDAATSPLQT